MLPVSKTAIQAQIESKRDTENSSVDGEIRTGDPEERKSRILITVCCAPVSQVASKSACRL